MKEQPIKDRHGLACVAHPRKNWRARKVRPRRIWSRDQMAREAKSLRTPKKTHTRPKTRGDCADGIRPCPYVGCRYHLAISITHTGNIILNFPDIEVWEMEDTCALDIADRGPSSIELVGAYVNVTRQRAQNLCDDVRARLQVALAEAKDED